MKFGIGNNDSSKYVDLADGQLCVLDYTQPMSYPSTNFDLQLVDRSNNPAGVIRRQLELEHLLNQAGRFVTDKYEIDAVWLYARPEGQDRTYRKLIVGVEGVNLPHRTRRGPFRPGQGAQFINIGLQTMPAWEEVDIVSTSGLDLHSAGDSFYVAAGGTVPGRASLFVTSFTFRSSDIGKVYAGIIPDYRQTMSGLTIDPKWLAEDSTPQNGYSLVGSIADSISATVLETDLSASADMHGLLHVSRGWYRGNYLVLLRYRFAGASGDRAMVMFESGYLGTLADARIASPPVYLSNTGSDWKLAPLGVVSFPLAVDRQSAADDTYLIGDQILSIRGKRLAGTNNLYLDTVTYIPSDISVTITNANLGNDGGVRVMVYPDDAIGALMRNESYEFSAVIASPRSWNIPTLGGTLMVATAAADDVQDKDNLLSVALHGYRRWQTYQRGIFTP